MLVTSNTIDTGYIRVSNLRQKLIFLLAKKELRNSFLHLRRRMAYLLALLKRMPAVAHSLSVEQNISFPTFVLQDHELVGWSIPQLRKYRYLILALSGDTSTSAVQLSMWLHDAVLLTQLLSEPSHGHYATKCFVLLLIWRTKWFTPKK